MLRSPSFVYFGKATASCPLRLNARSRGTASRSLTRAREITRIRVLWRDENFPRLITEFPRRIPQPNVPSILQGFGGELRDLFVPSSFTGQELLSWRLLVLACIVLAVAAELLSVTRRAASRLTDKQRRKSRPWVQKQLDGPESGLGPEMPDIPKTKAAEEQLEESRTLYRNEIKAERARGLKWFAIITAIAVWSTGILTRDNALAP